MYLNYLIKYGSSHIYEIYSTISGLIALIISINFKKQTIKNSFISFILGAGIFLIISIASPQITPKVFSTFFAGMLPLAFQLFWHMVRVNSKWRLGFLATLIVCMYAEYLFMISTNSHYKFCYALKIFVTLLALLEMLRSTYGYIDDLSSINMDASSIHVKYDDQGKAIAARQTTPKPTKIIGTIVVLLSILIIGFNFIWKNIIIPNVYKEITLQVLEITSDDDDELLKVLEKSLTDEEQRDIDIIIEKYSKNTTFINDMTRYAATGNTDQIKASIKSTLSNDDIYRLKEIYNNHLTRISNEEYQEYLNNY